MPVRRAYLDVDGRQLHYRIAGDPGRPAVLLLHQSPSHSVMYEPLMAALGDSFFLLAPDTPGFGNSDPLDVEEWDIEDLAAAIRPLLPALAIEHCHLFGHHTGAAIAVALEHDFPGTALSMALCGPTLLDEEQKRTLPALAETIPPVADGSHLAAMWRRLRAKDESVDPRLSQRELASAFASGEAYQASYRAVTRQDFGGQLAAIECPVLVFAGDADPLYGAVAPSLALLQHGHSAELAGGERTYVCERNVDRVASLLQTFFNNPIEV